VSPGPLRDARGALGLLTVVGGAAAPTPRSTVWFGPVGASIGGLVGATWWAADRAGPSAALVAAGLAVAVDLALTGLLHVDGLADAADGLLPPLDRERRLAVMRRPDTGAFGVGVVVAVLLLRWSALASLTPAPALVAALWALARGGMAATMALVPYARRDGGLASPFVAGSVRPAGFGAGVALALALFLAIAPDVGVGLGRAAALGVLAAAAGGMALTVALARRRVGGYTGDVLGAAGLVGETAGLVVAVLVR
jgi:adenosylcobinamide-GDP ribazoletransferase